jgi:Probable zinc-ribbon domain
MAKQGRRVPRYQREDPAWREADRRRKAGIPSDAVLADLTQQAPNNSYSPPRFYRDYEYTCVDCGSPQVWTAEEQKW